MLEPGRRGEVELAGGGVGFLLSQGVVLQPLPALGGEGSTVVPGGRLVSRGGVGSRPFGGVVVTGAFSSQAKLASFFFFLKWLHILVSTGVNWGSHRVFISVALFEGVQDAPQNQN